MRGILQSGLSQSKAKPGLSQSKAKPGSSQSKAKPASSQKRPYFMQVMFPLYMFVYAFPTLWIG